MPVKYAACFLNVVGLNTEPQGKRCLGIPSFTATSQAKQHCRAVHFPPLAFLVDYKLEEKD